MNTITAYYGKMKKKLDVLIRENMLMFDSFYELSTHHQMQVRLILFLLFSLQEDVTRNTLQLWYEFATSTYQI